MSEFIETIKALDGRIYNLDYHQKRYEDVLNSYNVSEYKNLKDYLTPPSDGLYRCRLTYDLKCINVEYFKYKKRNVKNLKLIYDNDINYSKKYASRENINKLFEKKQNCDDILIVKDSLLTDTSIANIALFNGSKWFTPKIPLLKGTTRQRLLDENKIFEKDIKADNIFEYKKIALLNAMIDFDIIAVDDIKDIIC